MDEKFIEVAIYHLNPEEFTFKVEMLVHNLQDGAILYAKDSELKVYDKTGFVIAND